MTLAARKVVLAVLLVLFGFGPLMSMLQMWLTFIVGVLGRLQPFTLFSLYTLAKLLLATVSLIALIRISLAFFAEGWSGLLSVRRLWWLLLCLSFALWVIDSIQHIVEVRSALQKVGSDLPPGVRTPGQSWSDHGITVALLAMGLIPNIFLLFQLRAAKLQGLR
jgi:hypothetical protein